MIVKVLRIVLGMVFMYYGANIVINKLSESAMDDTRFYGGVMFLFGLVVFVAGFTDNDNVLKQNNTRS